MLESVDRIKLFFLCLYSMLIKRHLTFMSFNCMGNEIFITVVTLWEKKNMKRKYFLGACTNSAAAGT
jgi:hypothetical protein